MTNKLRVGDVISFEHSSTFWANGVITKIVKQPNDSHYYYYVTSCGDKWYVRNPPIDDFTEGSTVYDELKVTGHKNKSELLAMVL